MKKFMFVLIAVFFVTAAVSAYACCGGCGSHAKADVSKSSQAAVDVSKTLKADAKTLVCPMANVEGNICDASCEAKLKAKSTTAACCAVKATDLNAKCLPGCTMIQKADVKKVSMTKHVCDAKCGNSCMAMSQSTDKNADAASSETAQ